MKNTDFNIDILELPERENTVAEIDYKKHQWVEISAEIPNKFSVQFYPHPENGYWEFPYDEAMEVLEEAKKSLAKYQRTPEQQAAYEARMKELENWNPTPEETAEYERKMEEQRKKYYG
ncbi:hypothetical protein [Candidatus Neptunichlamydia sp. REUL1]|uniref:hypothetical protein n=1 Tax=Candidatus Neptunichlamydia sp. REUL1 TaxID=3064277 RepID=UPI0029308DBF|nr:hypothetical protein [Candidatus Neptunochlamydia sp. REUL1]